MRLLEDPRLRERRIAVRRAEGRRRLRRLLIVCGAGVLAAAAHAVSRSPLFDVDEIAVRGTRRIAADAVVAASGLRTGQPLTDVDGAAVRSRLRAALPGLRDVAVARSIGGRVTITIEERREVAIAHGADGGWRLVDEDGRVLSAVSGPLPPLPIVLGREPAGDPGTTLDASGRDAVVVATALPEQLAPEVVAIAYGDAGLELRLTDDRRAVLGDTRLLGAKLVSLVAVLTDVAGDPFSVVDVRVPDAPVLTGGGT